MGFWGKGEPPGRATETAEVVDADASVRFGSNPARMKVGVSRYIPAQGSGLPLSVELLRKSLRDTGITAPMDEKNAAEIVRLLLAGQDASSIVVARGTPPQTAQDAWVELAGPVKLPVLPGQVIGRLHQAVLAQEGLDIAGNTVPPPKQPAPRIIAAGSGIAQDRDGLLTAKIAGLVRGDDTKIELAPLVQISADKLQAVAALYPRDAQGAEITPEGMVQVLASQGVSFGIQLEHIAVGLAQARTANKALEGVVVAQGHAPVHGENGRLEVMCGDHACAEAPEENARIDYRNRGLFAVAGPGDTIARLHQPTRGVPGRDIYGMVVPARDGVALRLVLGKNVEAQDGGASFRAKIAGVILAVKGTLDVSELLSVPGDVDYGTGNIQLTQGSVRIGGTVRTGFTVQVPGQVLVEGMVESAHIKAGGDVLVRGGIFMSGDEAASIEAGGSVSAAFTHNAQIDACGDVTVALSIVGSKTNKGSRVSSGGMVRITDPKGRIMGGTVVCASGLEVFDAGSERGMTTTLALSHETPEIEALIKELRELKELKQRAVFVVGEGNGATALAKLFNERRAEAEELLARREGIDSRLKQIQQTLAQLAQEYLERVKNARITIRGTVYPGVAIKMGGRSLHVERALEHCVFSWDAENKDIVTGSL